MTSENGKVINPEIPAEQIQSDEISDLIGNPPSWIVHSGISLIFGFVTIGLLLCMIIQYPDKLEGQVIIGPENPMVMVVSPQSGKIQSQFFADRQTVKDGDTLAILENNTKLADLRKFLRFESDLENLLSKPGYPEITFPANLQLGELQLIYGKLQHEYEKWQKFVDDKSTEQKIAALEREISHLNDLNGFLEQQIQSFQSEFKLREKEYRRNETLFQSNTISEKTLEQNKIELLQYRRQVDVTESNRIQNNIRSDQLSSQVEELKSVYAQTNQEHQLILREICQQFKASLEQWELKYLIKASTTGVLNWFPDLGEGQHVTASQSLGKIIPLEGTGAVIARCQLSPDRFGKLKSEQKAIFRMDGYPYKEFGVLQAKVGKLPLALSRNDNNEPYYQLDIPMPDTLVTNYHKQMLFQSEMTGQVIIITEQQSLFERIFQQLVSLTESN